MEKQSTGNQLIIGTGMAIFILGAVFWAGATYNRIAGIEGQLGVITSTLDQVAVSVSDLAALKIRLSRVEDDVKDLHNYHPRVKQQ